MKSLLSILLFLCSSLMMTAVAQDSVRTQSTHRAVSIAPLGFGDKARVGYYYIMPQATLGIQASGHYGHFRGLELFPQLRLHLARGMASSYYLMVGLPMFFGKVKPFKLDYYDMDGNVVISKKATAVFRSTGLAVGIGKFYNIGRDERFFIDLYAGVRFMPYPPRKSAYSAYDERTGQTLTTRLPDEIKPKHWYGIGPGSIVQAHLGIGMKF